MAVSKRPRHGAQQHASGTVQMGGRGEKAHTCQTKCVESTSEKVEKEKREERGRREGGEREMGWRSAVATEDMLHAPPHYPSHAAGSIDALCAVGVEECVHGLRTAQPRLLQTETERNNRVVQHRMRTRKELEKE